MALQNTPLSFDSIRIKSDAYFNIISEHVRAIRNDPTMIMSAEEVNALIAQTLEFINDNQLLTTPQNVQPNTRLRTELYNDIIDTARVDLEVIFARMRAVEKTINTTARLFNAKSYSILSQIDILLDKISNLSDLKNTYSQYDDVIYDTFVDDNNTEFESLKTNHGESGGIITLRDIDTDEIVQNQRNFDLFLQPLNDKAIVEINNRGITSSSLADGLDFSLFSKNDLFVTDFQIGFTGNTFINDSGFTANEVKAITYNGGTVAVILRLAAIKFVNHMSMKFSSSGLTDVIDVLYSQDAGDSLTSADWNVIEFTADNNNIRGTDINFNPVEAGSLMIILGQKSVKDVSVEKKLGFAKFSQEKQYNLPEIINQIQGNYNVVTNGKIKEVASNTVVENLSQSTSNLLDSLLTNVEMMLPSEERDTDLTDPSQFVNLKEYNFSIYDLKVEYVHYLSNSTFKSDQGGGLGEIETIALTANDKTPSLETSPETNADTIVNYYIELENGQQRIVPQGKQFVYDIFTIEEASNGVTLDTELLIKDGSVVVFINDDAILAGLFEVNKQFSGSSVGLGVIIDPSIALNFGDTIVIRYEVADSETDGRVYNPYEINIDEALGNPTLNNPELNRGTATRAVVEMDDDSFVSFNIPTEIRRAPLPAESLVSGQTETEVGYLFTDSGKAKIDYYGGPLPVDNIVGGTSGDYYVKSDNVKLGTETIYDGIINESLAIASGQTQFEVAHNYVPGTLHVTSKGRPIATSEYLTDPVSGVILDKDTFDTSGVEYEGSLLASYIPIDQSIEAAESNISSYNYSEFFQGTNDESTIELPIAPHVDPVIRKEAYSAGTQWIPSSGKFINRFNQEIVYEPIRVIINGKIVENITDYRTYEVPTFSIFRQDVRNYQYYVLGNKLVFNTPIVGNLINVNAYKQNDNFKSVIKMYRANRKQDDITPEVYGFATYLNKRG